ncbi:MAG: DNA recombination protein RmuC [Ruminococcus sp.]|nr:DNA recombination protein RmuC [Ruminococcus sp.]
MFTDIQFVIVAVLLLVVAVLLAVVLIKLFTGKDNSERLAQKIRQEAMSDNAILRQEVTAGVQQSVKTMGDMIALNQKQSAESNMRQMAQLEERFKTFSVEQEQKLELIRTTVEKRLQYMQEDNSRKLDEMRQTVDDKLQKTLEEKMNQSFALVNERLEQVYKGLGEMRTLAVGVGDLKKVLSNVKTRGILGEIQLGSILKEILSPSQYEENVATKPRSTERVEFAVKLPAEDDGFIYLPIDSKFPGDTYAALQDAYDSGSPEQVESAVKTLIATLKKEAKDISEKYIAPPHTTEFAIMFLPTEGLYAEAVNRGMVEILQRDYKVNIAGPSTMAALLNSLQMGFKTLAVQKRSAEVWQLLGSVKAEFDKFNDVLLLTQQRLDQANAELDKLVGVRTRQICRKLSGVQANDTPLDSYQTQEALEETSDNQ